MKSTYGDANRRYALLWCSRVAEIDYRHLMVDAFRIWGEEWEILDPSDPDLIQKSEAFDGFVISGSELSVVEDRGNPIVDNLIDLIRDIYQSRSSPMIGICFGSQAIAMALGGNGRPSR